MYLGIAREASVGMPQSCEVIAARLIGYVVTRPSMIPDGVTLINTREIILS